MGTIYMTENKPNYILASDLAQHEQLDKIISEKIKFTDLSTKDVIMVYKSLVWFAQLKAKLNDNIFDTSEAKMKPIKKTGKTE